MQNEIKFARSVLEQHWESLAREGDVRAVAEIFRIRHSSDQKIKPEIEAVRNILNKAIEEIEKHETN